MMIVNHENISESKLNKAKNWYIGGLPQEKRREILFKRGLTSFNTSIQGCLKLIRINGKSIGFPNFQITNNIDRHCIWDYLCLERKPCILSSKCIQENTNMFSCQCDQLYCLRADYRENYSVCIV